MPYPNGLSKSVLQVVKTFTILLYSRTYTFVWSLFYIILLTGQPILNETIVLHLTSNLCIIRILAKSAASSTSLHRLMS